MDSKNDHSLSDQSRQDEPPQPPKKRFQIVKLEERIAPKTNKCKSCGATGSSPYPGASVF